jgi:large subunit ribosomal protein L23
MGIFDKIIGKESTQGGPVSDGEKKPENKPKKAVLAKSEKKEKKPEVKKTAEKPKAKPTGKKMIKREENIAHQIILEPIISEKSTALGAENKYVFKVSQNSGKFQIKEAIEGYYGVKVLGVNTIKIPPKKRIHGRFVGYKKGYKKAIVKLRQGDTIGIAEGV